MKYINAIGSIGTLLFGTTLLAAQDTETLIVDIGNTRTKVALARENIIVHQQSFSTSEDYADDKIYIWLEDNFLLSDKLTGIAISSVVPHKNQLWENLAIKLKTTAFFLKTENTKGLVFDLDTPSKMGADRIAGLIGAKALYPKQNLIIIDMGTATTINILTKSGVCLGGAILTGLQSSLDGLISATALLPSVKISESEMKIGKNTTEQLQLHFHFYVAGLKYTCRQLAMLAFDGVSSYCIIGTGGYSVELANQNLFDAIIPDLKLIGILKAYTDYKQGSWMKDAS